MSLVDRAPAEAFDLELQECLERIGVDAAGIAAVERTGSEHWGSYETYVVTVRLADGEERQLFLKDLGRSKLPKDDVAQRRERERRVYAELLDGAELGTARFYGAHWDESAARFWLLLEFVDGEPLRYRGFEYWLEAAAWLGRLHKRFAGGEGRLEGCRFLARHDAGFFAQAAERALEAVSEVTDVLARRLGAVLESYDAIVPLLARDPDVLVHGSYRPQNLLVARSSGRLRICPTDWELAAFGRSAYDLAFLCDGFGSPRLDALLHAYEREAESFGFPVSDGDELRRDVDCFRLYKTISSLGHLRVWPHPEETAVKVVATAEQIADSLA